MRACMSSFLLAFPEAFYHMYSGPLHPLFGVMYVVSQLISSTDITLRRDVLVERHVQHVPQLYLTAV